MKNLVRSTKVSDISKEELGDLVEKELQSTHETIDEAVRQLEVRKKLRRRGEKLDRSIDRFV